MNLSHKKVFESFSSAQTKNFAAKLAKEILSILPQKYATVLALQGDLGAGKTTFAQGFLKGLGVKEKTASPTFIIMRKFSLRHNNFHHLYHIDVYRISVRSPSKISQNKTSEGEAGMLGLKKIFRDPKNIVLIEWAENIKKIIPKNAVWIYFVHSKSKNRREIKIKSDAFLRRR